uniref:Uncharacterized protein n=1 Tax=Ditylenchus dipsaci TaxID=166011 RepID=A0A915DYT5_9BILA
MAGTGTCRIEHDFGTFICWRLIAFAGTLRQLVDSGAALRLEDLTCSGSGLENFCEAWLLLCRLENCFGRSWPLDFIDDPPIAEDWSTPWAQV